MKNYIDLTHFIPPKIREFYKNSYGITEIKGFNFETRNGIKKYFLAGSVNGCNKYDIGKSSKNDDKFLYLDPKDLLRHNYIMYNYMSKKIF